MIPRPQTLNPDKVELWDAGVGRRYAAADGEKAWGWRGVAAGFRGQFEFHRRLTGPNPKP